MLYPARWKKDNCWSEQSPEKSTVPFFFFLGGGGEGAPGIVMESATDKLYNDCMESVISTLEKMDLLYCAKFAI